MENPFEIINQRLDRIEKLLQNLNSIKNNKNSIGTYPEIMDVKALTEYLNVSSSYIYKMTSTNQIPHSKKGKKLYFDKEKVTNWALENTVMTQEEMQEVATKYLLKRKLKY
ncbi:helix-turn-helix domain-containing protein [Polaribacter sp. R77954]|uniref:helix-turn-helix domain-containing protein n=1 Tax=Polaribacter sp. R77954 TaxID=3093870 RepID=UPI0037CA28D4